MSSTSRPGFERRPLTARRPGAQSLGLNFLWARGVGYGNVKNTKAGPYRPAPPQRALEGIKRHKHRKPQATGNAPHGKSDYWSDSEVGQAVRPQETLGQRTTRARGGGGGRDAGLGARDTRQDHPGGDDRRLPARGVRALPPLGSEHVSPGARARLAAPRRGGGDAARGSSDFHVCRPVLKS